MWNHYYDNINIKNLQEKSYMLLFSAENVFIIIKDKNDYISMEDLCRNEYMEKCATTIYKMLSVFEKQLDKEVFETELLKPEVWKIPETRFYRYLQMLVESGYITGITVKAQSGGVFYANLGDPRITLKGIEYLTENSLMQKAFNIIKKGAELTVQII